jgi:hypothetical protein
MNRDANNEILNAPISGVTAQTAIVAAPGAGKRILVLALGLTLTVAGTAQWHSAAGNALTGAMTLASGTPLQLSHPDGVLKCNANEALNLTCVTGTGAGWVRYIIVNS